MAASKESLSHTYTVGALTAEQIKLITEREGYLIPINSQNPSPTNVQFKIDPIHLKSIKNGGIREKLGLHRVALTQMTSEKEKMLRTQLPYVSLEIDPIDITRFIATFEVKDLPLIETFVKNINQSENLTKFSNLSASASANTPSVDTIETIVPHMEEGTISLQAIIHAAKNNDVNLLKILAPAFITNGNDINMYTRDFSKDEVRDWATVMHFAAIEGSIDALLFLQFELQGQRGDMNKPTNLPQKLTAMNYLERSSEKYSEYKRKLIKIECELEYEKRGLSQTANTAKDKALADLTVTPPTSGELEYLEYFKGKYDVAESEFYKHKVENERLFAIAISIGNDDIASILIKKGTNICNAILVENTSFSIIDYLHQAAPIKLIQGTFAVCHLLQMFPGIRTIWDKYYLLLAPLIKLLHTGEDKSQETSNLNIVAIQGLFNICLENPYPGEDINLSLEDFLSNIIQTLASLKPGFHQNSLFFVLGDLMLGMLVKAKLKGVPVYKNFPNGENESAFVVALKRIKALCNGNEYALLALECALLPVEDKWPTYSDTTIETPLLKSSKKQFNKSKLDNEESEFYALWKEFTQKIPETFNEKPKALLEAEDYLKLAFQERNYQIINVLISEGVNLETLVSVGGAFCLPLSALCLDLSNDMPLTLVHLKCLKLLLDNNANFTPDVLPLHKIILHCRYPGEEKFSTPRADIAIKMIRLLLKHKQDPNARNDGNQTRPFILKNTSVELVVAGLSNVTKEPDTTNNQLKKYYLKKALSIFTNAREMNYRLFSNYENLFELFGYEINIAFSNYPIEQEKVCPFSDLSRDLACQVVKLLEEEYNKALSVKEEKKSILPDVTEPPNKKPGTAQIAKNTTYIDIENLVTVTYSVIIPKEPVLKEALDIFCSNRQDRVAWNDSKRKDRLEQIREIKREHKKFIPKIIEKFNRSIFRFATDGLKDAYNFGLTLAFTHPEWQPYGVGKILLDYYTGAAIGAVDIYSNPNNPFFPSFIRGWEYATQNAIIPEPVPIEKTLSDKSTASKVLVEKLRTVGSASASSDEPLVFEPIPEIICISEITREETRALLRPLLFQMNSGIRIRNHMAMVNVSKAKSKNNSL